MIENLDVTSWERLAANAATEHEKNLVQRNSLTRRRASAALAGMMTGELDATADLDNELCALEARIVGHSEVRRMIQRGLEAAIELKMMNIYIKKFI